MKDALELHAPSPSAPDGARGPTRDPEVHLAAFRVGSDEMVIDIMRIREILRPVPVTPLPRAPEGVRGMINLRGSVIPIIDVRARFGLPPMEGARTHRVMVVLDRRRLWGLHVDAVMEVARVPRSVIRPGGDIFSGAAAEVFSGVVEHKGRLMLMLNLGRFIQFDARIPTSPRASFGGCAMTLTLSKLGVGEASRRVVFCPDCQRRYRLPLDLLGDTGIRLVCGNCEAVFRPAEPQAIPAPGPREMARRPTVVVAHESPAVCATVGMVLEDAGYAPRFVHDGGRALASFDEALPDRPVALVLDVGIPEVLAFQVCQVMRTRPTGGASACIILLASVFERTRYKRRPTSLHGADGYLELHHVPDRLGPLLGDLLARRPTQNPTLHTPLQRARAETLADIPEELVHDLDSARVLARRLVSDVALYHEGGLARGLQKGAPLEDADVLAALQEARVLFARKVDPALSANRVFDDAVEELATGLRHGRDPGAR